MIGSYHFNVEKSKSKRKSRVSQAVSSWKTSCHHELPASPGNNFGNGERGSHLSSLTCTSSEESERDEDPSEMNFSENPFMTKFFGLRDWDCTISRYYDPQLWKFMPLWHN